MNKVKKLFLLIILLSLVACDDENYYNKIAPTLKISEPTSRFLTEEYDYVLVRLETDVTKNEVEKVEFIYWAVDLYDEIEHKVIEESPFETEIYIPKSCVEHTYLFITSKLYLQSGKTVYSDTVWGYVNKNLPQNNEMNIYDYEAFDNDSVLVAEGMLAIVQGYYPLGFNNTLLGRRDINYISGDSTFEKGMGFLEGYIKQNNSFYIKLTPCELTGLQAMGIVGNWDNNEILEGDRYFFPDHTPIGNKIGTFKAIRRN
jgi:hypothetical protein